MSIVFARWFSDVIVQDIKGRQNYVKNRKYDVTLQLPCTRSTWVHRVDPKWRDLALRLHWIRYLKLEEWCALSLTLCHHTSISMKTKIQIWYLFDDGFALVVFSAIILPVCLCSCWVRVWATRIWVFMCARQAAAEICWARLQHVQLVSLLACRMAIHCDTRMPSAAGEMKAYGN